MLSIGNLKILKYHAFPKKTVLSVICIKCKHEGENKFREEESIEILEILGLIENI